jgi:hypothetical protein
MFMGFGLFQWDMFESLCKRLPRRHDAGTPKTIQQFVVFDFVVSENARIHGN